ARHDARLIRDRVLPAYQDAIGYAEKYVGAMQLNMLFLLEARKELFTNSRRYIDALREARAAQVDLERALGGALPSTETDS
ncbi:MAG: hypothetical protein ACE5KY_05555, partial [Candidatus Tectimicrobiota bacterium]